MKTLSLGDLQLVSVSSVNSLKAVHLNGSTLTSQAYSQVVTSKRRPTIP